MKVKGTQLKATDGSEFIPSGMDKVKPLVVDMVTNVMMVYGVKKFDIGFLPFGSIPTCVPKVGDIENLTAARPAVLNQAMREVFRNLANVLLMHGMASVEIYDITDEELKNVTSLWEEISNG